jgi:hypothetical protein
MGTANKKIMRNPALITGFVTVEMLGWIGCFILLLTVVLSRKIQRHATWINLCLAWILSGISFSLLFIGRQQLKDKPNPNLCLLQAALVYASPLLTSSATLSLAIHLLFSIHSSLYSVPETERFHRIRTTILVIFPYLTYIAVFIWVVVMGAQHPKAVFRLPSGLICGIKIETPGRFSAAFVAATTIVTVSIEGVIITEMWRNWRAYKGENKDALVMIIRVLCFSFCSAVSAAVTLVYLRNRKPSNIAMYRMVPALNPLAFFIIFSTQKDIFDTWMFWRQRPQPSRWQPPVMHLHTERDSFDKNTFKPLKEYV